MNIDLIGKKFNKLTITGLSNKQDKKYQHLWFCKCECGIERLLPLYLIRRYKSCGCVRRKHGDHLTRLYSVWRNIRHRCSCKTNKDYKNYGARGISVSSDWKNYVKFKDWALASGYKEGLTIERKNNDMGYSADNCIFISVAENNKNKSNSYHWYLRGKRFKSASDASIYFNVVENTIRGWCVGYKVKKYYYPPLTDCYRIKKYGEKQCLS